MEELPTREQIEKANQLADAIPNNVLPFDKDGRSNSEDDYTPNSEYLGDGVYAINDHYGIWLHANDHKYPTDRIFLEPQVLEALNNFAKKIQEEKNA